MEVLVFWLVIAFAFVASRTDSFAITAAIFGLGGAIVLLYRKRDGRFRKTVDWLVNRTPEPLQKVLGRAYFGVVLALLLAFVVLLILSVVGDIFRIPVGPDVLCC